MPCDERRETRTEPGRADEADGGNREIARGIAKNFARARATGGVRVRLDAAFLDAGEIPDDGVDAGLDGAP
jgi:hypothetical protein